MRVAAPAMTPSVRLLSPTSYSERGSGWLFITDCGMVLFKDPAIRRLLRNSLETAQFDQGEWKDVGQGPGSDAGDFVNWLTFDDETSSVLSDVTRIRRHPLVPPSIPIYGYVYDVRGDENWRGRGLANCSGGVPTAEARLITLSLRLRAGCSHSLDASSGNHSLCDPFLKDDIC